MRKILLSIYKIYKYLPRAVPSQCRPILRGFRSVRGIHNFIISHLKPDFIEVQGHKIFLDWNDFLNLSIKEYEPLETEFVKKEIKKGDIVLDLGAHIGYYTLIFAKLVGEEGKIFAFEPDPSNFALLKKNVEINGYRNVVLVQKAVSNKSGEVRLFLSEDNTLGHRICDSHDGRRFIEVEAIRLDDYFKNHNGKIDFIKMDIEGAEWLAIEGMSSLLKKNKNLKMVTEFFPLGLKIFGIEPKEYLKLFLKHGFKLYRINEGRKRIEPANITQLLEIYTSKREKSTNLLCIRE